MSAKQYIEKVQPLVVEAEAFDPKKPHTAVAVDPDSDTGIVHTSGGEQLQVKPGDMIVTYADGQVRPMAKDLFDATFRKATKQDAPALSSSTDPS